MYGISWMNPIINSATEIRNKCGWTVFLAGPMHSSPRGWRNRLVRTAEEMGMDNITFLSPRYKTMRMPSNQVQWETQGLRMCDVALFWIPNKDPKAELGTRVYAETTKMELAENIARGKKIILGIDTEINGTRHMEIHSTNNEKLFLAGGDMFSQECIERHDGMLAFIHKGFNALWCNKQKALEEGNLTLTTHFIDQVPENCEQVTEATIGGLSILADQGCRKIDYITIIDSKDDYYKKFGTEL